MFLSVSTPSTRCASFIKSGRFRSHSSSRLLYMANVSLVTMAHLAWWTSRMISADRTAALVISFWTMSIVKPLVPSSKRSGDWVSPELRASGI
ncbi:hypothetical protein KCU88_g64, partial [Aureobasidium melanogenum]